MARGKAKSPSDRRGIMAGLASPAYGRDMDADSLNTPKPTLTQTLFVTFLRVVAVACFWFGLQYWAMLVGYSLHGMGRFDLLNVPWRLAATGLAVVFPVAALGLWLAVSWGPVIWLIGAGGQILMHGVWNDIFGHNGFVISMHALIAAAYLLFRVALWLERRHRAEEVGIDLP